MDDYDIIKKSSLKFKGDKRNKKHKGDKSKSKTLDESEIALRNERIEDAENHGGWWKVDHFDQIQDAVAVEFTTGCYAKALDNGKIVLGDQHAPGDQPEEDEIFIAIRCSNNQVAFKTGFGRYLSVDEENKVMGLSKAMGERELFLCVFEDDKLALCSSNDKFIGPDNRTKNNGFEQIVAIAEKVGPNEIANLRVKVEPKRNRNPFEFEL